jgi:hypothetical protein
MPRVRRIHMPAVVTHVIVRFVNGEPVMDLVDGARQQYLQRLDHALCDSDWCLCWYCLMGNHVHLGMVAGETTRRPMVGSLQYSFWSGSDHVRAQATPRYRAVTSTQIASRAFGRNLKADCLQHQEMAASRSSRLFLRPVGRAYRLLEASG